MPHTTLNLIIHLHPSTLGNIYLVATDITFQNPLTDSDKNRISLTQKILSVRSSS